MRRTLQRRMALSRQMLNRRPVPAPRPDPPKDRPLTPREQDAVIQHDVDRLRKGPR